MARIVHPSFLDPDRKDLRPKPRLLTDAAGRPVVGFIERDLAEPRWYGRSVRFYCPLEERINESTGRISLYRRARLVFHGSKKWYDSRDVYAPPKNGMKPMALMHALRTLSHDFWWISASGALERRATNYEARLTGEENEKHPPKSGWKLVSAEGVQALIAYSKNLSEEVMPMKSETDVSLERAAKLKRLERDLRSAESTLAKHRAGLEQKARVVRKWEKKIERLKALSTSKD